MIIALVLPQWGSASASISRAARLPHGGTFTGGMLAEIPGRVYMMEYCGGRVSLKQGHARGEHRVWPSGRIHGAEAMRRKKPCAGSTTVAVTLAVFLLFFTLITLYLFAAKYWRPPDPITSFGREIDQQFARTFLITGIVFVLSQLALGWVVFRFRDTGGRATFSHGNTTMEVLWTLATLVLFVGLGIYAERAWAEVHFRGAAPGALQIERSEERRVGKECRSRWSPYH